MQITTSNANAGKPELLPPRYNVQTTLQADVKAGENEINFALRNRRMKRRERDERQDNSCRIECGGGSLEPNQICCGRFRHPAQHVFAARAGADDTHLLIISIDGLRGDWAAHPDKHGLKVPNLRKLAARGAHADAVLGVFPSVTYPSHTTLITGCRPARHGILANGVFEPPTVKQIERWYWDYKDIRVPTILDAARSAGWTTASVGWPVSVGAPVDVLFPEVWEPNKHDEAIVAMSRLCKPPDLLAEVLTKYDLHGGPDSDINRANVTRYIVDRYKPRLMLSHLNDLDHIEHAKGPESAEARETLERLDGYVGDIVERYEKNGLLDKTIVAVVSDHGFLAVEHSFGVNALLREKGLIRVDEKSTGPASDWDAAGWIAGGACAIVLKKPDDAATLERVREALRPTPANPTRPSAASSNATKSPGSVRTRRRR